MKLKMIHNFGRNVQQVWSLLFRKYRTFGISCLNWKRFYKIEKNRERRTDNSQLAPILFDIWNSKNRIGTESELTWALSKIDEKCLALEKWQETAKISPRWFSPEKRAHPRRKWLWPSCAGIIQWIIRRKSCDEQEITIRRFTRFERKWAWTWGTFSNN